MSIDPTEIAHWVSAREAAEEEWCPLPAHDFDTHHSGAGVLQAVIAFVTIGIWLGVLLTIMLIAAIGH